MPLAASILLSYSLTTSINIYWRRLFILSSIILLYSVFPTTAQWRKITAMPEPYLTQGYWLDVFFLPAQPRFGWACGFNGMIIRTTDGGETWQGVTIDADPLRRGMLESIQFVDSLVGYTSGPAGIFKSIDGGRTWRDIMPPTPYSLWGCFFLTRDIGIFMGSGCGLEQQFWRTTNGGSSWTLFEGSVSGSGLSDAVITNTLGYPAPLTPGLGYAQSSGIVWRTLDTGRTWRPFSDLGERSWQEEMAYRRGTFIIPYSGGPTSCSGSLDDGGMWCSSDTGRTWRKFSTGKPMYGSFVIDSARGWGAGSGGSVVYTTNAGISWEYRNCGIAPDADLDDIWFVNDTIGFVVGQGVYKTSQLPEPIITVIGGTQLCEGDSTILQAPAPLGTLPLRYQWSNGATTQSIIIRQAGTYTVTITEQGNCRRTSQAVTITVTPLSRIELTSSQSQLRTCFGSGITLSSRFTNNTNGTLFPLTVTWLLDGRVLSTTTIISPQQEALYIANTTGTYTARVQNIRGCMSSSSLSITILPLPQVSITANAQQACRGDSIILTATPGFTRYLWSNGATTPTLIVRSNGIFTVRVTDANDCSTVSAPIEVGFFEGGRQLQIVETVSGGSIRFDSVAFGALRCRDVRIRNTHPMDTFYIQRTFLSTNIEFSTPLGQFPLMIPPLQERTMSICFAPRSNQAIVDTVWISRECGAFRIPIRGQGIGTQLSGTSRCTAIISSLSTQRGNIRIGQSNIYPNPITHRDESIMADIELSGNSFDLAMLPPPTAQIFSMQGHVVAVPRIVLERSDSLLYHYHAEIPSSQLLQGVYVWRMTIGTHTSTQLFVVVK